MVLGLALCSMVLFSQPLPYDTSIGGGEGSNPVGGGAPLSGGLLILLSLGLGYGTKKTFEWRNRKKMLPEA